jgi:hypothetical protein
VHIIGSIPAPVAGRSDREDENWMDSLGYTRISFGYMRISIGYHSWICTWITLRCKKDILNGYPLDYYIYYG